MDIFDRIAKDRGPLGKYAETEGYFIFPQLEGELNNRMQFQGKEVIVWSVNNYLGLANHPEVRKADTQATEKYGLAYPMGSRMMSGDTSLHYTLEKEHVVSISYLCNVKHQQVRAITITFKRKRKRKSGSNVRKKQTLSYHNYLIISG